jgi:hypothetical protein
VEELDIMEAVVLKLHTYNKQHQGAGVTAGKM